jgi:hypothetical protein
MRKNIQVKRMVGLREVGELPDMKSLRMTRTDLAELRARHRSPFGFCGPRRAKG